MSRTEKPSLLDLHSSRMTRRQAIVVLGASAMVPLTLHQGTRAQEHDGRRALQPPLATPTVTPELESVSNHLPKIVSALADAGVSVFESAGDPLPLVDVPNPGPVSLLMSQLLPMAQELVAGGGIIASDLDALVSDRPLIAQSDQETLPDPTPLEIDGNLVIAPSLLVASYIQTLDSPGAALIRQYRADIVVERGAAQLIPSLALMLFAAEIAREHAGSVSSAAGGVRALVPTGVQGGICSQATGFIDAMLDRLFAALTVDLGDSLPGRILGGIINGVIVGFRVPIKAAIDALTKPVLSVIRDIAGVLAVAATVVSTIRPWTLRLTPDPLATRLAVGSEPGLPGTVMVQVDLGGLDEWPADVADCAAVSGVTLPSLKPEGARCTWRVMGTRPNLVQVDEMPGVLDRDAKAVLTYHTLSEPEEVAKGKPVNGVVIVTATVARPEIDELKRTLSSLLFAQLPELLERYVRPYLGPIVDGLLNQIGSLTDSQGQGTFVVVYHDPPEPTPEPEPSGEGGGSIEVVMEPTFPTSGDGAFIESVMALSASSCDGDAWSGTFELSYHVGAPGFTVDAEGISPISWTFDGSDQAVGSAGPFPGTLSIANVSENPLTYSLDLSVTRTRNPDDGSTLFTFGITLHSTSFGSTESEQVEGFSNLGVPIPVVPGGADCAT